LKGPPIKTGENEGSLAPSFSLVVKEKPSEQDKDPQKLSYSYAEYTYKKGSCTLKIDWQSFF